MLPGPCLTLRRSRSGSLARSTQNSSLGRELVFWRATRPLGGRSPGSLDPRRRGPYGGPVRKLLRRSRSDSGLLALVALMVVALLFPLHSHPSHEASTVAPEHCAWEVAGPRVVFGEAHADGVDHFCPLGHAGSLPSDSSTVAPPAPSPAFAGRPHAAPGFGLPRRPACRGPPSLAVS